MNGLLRRLRGVIGTGLTWAIGWAVLWGATILIAAGFGAFEGLTAVMFLIGALGGLALVAVFGVTLWIWILETIKYWLVSFAFPDLHLSYVGILLMGGAVNLLTALPSLPGYIGTFEVGIKILESIGAPSAPAGSYILVLHAILLIPVTLLGLLFMAREGIHWAEVWEAQGSQPEV